MPLRTRSIQPTGYGRTGSRCTTANPQAVVPNIFFAKPADGVKAMQRVHHAPGQASLIALPVVGN